MLSTFRAKLVSIVVTATLALGLVVLGGSLIGARQTRALAEVEGHLVPKFELGPRLQSTFHRLRQSFQDAVAAQDAAALDATAATKRELLDAIGSAGGALSPGEIAAMRRAVEEYYATAYSVSHRLIAGETGEELVKHMAEMQALQAKTAGLIEKSTLMSQDELSSGFAAVRNGNARADQVRLVIGLIGLGLVVALSFLMSRSVLRNVKELSDGFALFATGDLSQKIRVLADDEIGGVAKEANQMADNLRRLGEQRDKSARLIAAQVGLSNALRGELDPESVAEQALAFLAPRLEARAAAVYLSDERGVLRLSGAHAGGEAAADLPEAVQEKPVKSFGAGEGMVGQAARSEELLVVDDPPADYLKIRSGLGEAAPRALVFLPLSQLGKNVGVIELALFKACSEETKELLESTRMILVSALVVARSRAASRKLLEETQRLNERLSAQEEELRLNNQELRAQQEELRKANDELEKQRYVLSQQNAEIEAARRRVQQKADELAKVSTYKSQFLANMSHELRTPLNSMLLLSHLLAENEHGNLTQKQVEHSKTIHSAGQDLLALINQVLDLAKIEAGKQDVDFESVSLQRFAAYTRRVFEPLAAEKGLKLSIEIAPGLPEAIVTDQQRVERILTNLLGNAIKFTERGEVSFRIARPPESTRFRRDDLHPKRSIAFSVSDTGIGIPVEAQERVFAPFEQLESKTDRRYAGTGLGLAIARESAELIGGELTLESVSNRGSTFTCFLPDQPSQETRDSELHALIEEPREVPDDRTNLAAHEPHLLVIEDDGVLAEQLVDIIHARKFKVVVAKTARDGLRLAKEGRPQGILLDVKLPDIDGWTVMERLRQDPATRQIPVHFMSAVEAPERGLALGAIGYLTKPATHAELAGAVRALIGPSNGASRRILVVEDDAREGESIVELLAKAQIDARCVTSARQALDALRSESFGCMILDLGLPDMDGLELLETLSNSPELDAPRVVVHTGRALTKQETRQLEAYAEAVVLKDGSSAERLLEEVRIFVRHVKDNLSQKERPELVSARSNDISLTGLRILLAEDDMRTVYALSALLRGKGADVLVAENGREALDLLSDHADVQGVLMDIMMPEMDGYEAMRRLRKDPRFAELPVIALTARAMQGERERCLEAGASDYLTKPVDSERLLAALQTWLVPSGTNGAERQH